MSTDIAVWRLLEERNDSSEFDPLWKLLYMWDHPYHFPLAAWSALSGWAGRLWQELIGIVGWQDIMLPPWTYDMLTVLLLLVPLQKPQLDGAVRARVTVISGLVVLGYIVLVYLIFFSSIGPSTRIMFEASRDVISLSRSRWLRSALVNRELPGGMPSAIAIAGSMIAGITTVDEVLRGHW